jgi:hypothetical protein
MRLLGVKRWVWVLEFQTKTGDGWPHWHLLVDLFDAPGGRIDLNRAWHLWRDKWHLGGLDLQVKRFFDDPRHAVMYISKYLTKMPEAFPLWVIDGGRAIRFIGGAKRMGSLTGQPPRAQSEPAEPEGQLLLFREPRKPLVFRMARCGQMSSVFFLDGDCGTGAGGWSFMRRVNATKDDLLDMSERCEISVRLAAIEWGEKELLAISEASPGGVGGALARLERELGEQGLGYQSDWERRMSDRQEDIWIRHALYWHSRRSNAVSMN